MTMLLDTTKIGKIFIEEPEFFNPDLINYISSSLPTFKSHYGYRKVMNYLDEGAYKFKLLSKPIPVFTLIQNDDIIIDLNFIDKLGVAYKGNININPRAIYEAMLCGAILQELRKPQWVSSKELTDKFIKTFYPHISDILISIFMKLFAKKYGILSDEAKVEEFQSVTAAFIGRYMFKIQSLDIAKSLNDKITSTTDLMGDIFSVKDVDYNFYIDFISENILFGIKSREFKNTLFTRMGPQMIPAFELPKYSVALFTLLAFNSSILNINYIKSWNKSSFEILDKLVEHHIFY